jgi:hypothetical protein
MNCERCGRPLEEPKTLAQLAYYRGPVLDALTAYYNDKSDLPLPVHKSVVHERMLEAFLGLDENGKLRRSRHLNTAQYARMTDDIRAFLATKGIDVPGPGEQSYEESEFARAR